MLNEEYNAYGVRMKSEVERLIDFIYDSKKELVKNWLLARGWDGVSTEQAQKLSKGYKITQQVKDGQITFKIEKMTEEEIDRLEA